LIAKMRKLGISRDTADPRGERADWCDHAIAS
jgi:hypothetical protein